MGNSGSASGCDLQDEGSQAGRRGHGAAGRHGSHAVQQARVASPRWQAHVHLVQVRLALVRAVALQASRPGALLGKLLLAGAGLQRAGKQRARGHSPPPPAAHVQHDARASEADARHGDAGRVEAHVNGVGVPLACTGGESRRASQDWSVQRGAAARQAGETRSGVAPPLGLPTAQHLGGVELDKVFDRWGRDARAG